MHFTGTYDLMPRVTSELIPKIAMTKALTEAIPLVNRNWSGDKINLRHRHNNTNGNQKGDTKITTLIIKIGVKASIKLV